jgi:hypothetical protein
MQMSVDRNGENESVLKYQSSPPSPSILHVHFHLSFFFNVFPFDIFPSYHTFKKETECEIVVTLPRCFFLLVSCWQQKNTTDVFFFLSFYDYLDFFLSSVCQTH